MNLTLTLPALSYLIGTVLGAIVSAICYAYQHESQQSSVKYLAVSLFSLTWTLMILFLSESRLIQYVPHLFQTGFITSLLFLPFSYFFIRNLITGEQLSRKDLIHAVPIVFFIIDYSFIYLLPAEVKIEILSEKGAAYIYHEGWFLPAYIHRPLRFMLFFIYSGLQFQLALSKNKPLKKWVITYLSAQFLLIFYYVIYQFSFDPVVWRFISMLISAYLVFIAVALLFQPRMLYFHEFLTTENNLIQQLQQNGSDQVTESFQKKRMDGILVRLESHMKSASPFLRHGYSIHDLSNDMKMPSYQLSSFLNHHLGYSFNDYLNKYRIQHCLERMKVGAADVVTLEALAYECGFNNRNSFTAAFKRVTGITPSEFIRTQKKPSADA